jgi:hypothetical protein
LYQFNFTDPVPVELIAFTASSEGDRITLTWKTASELNNKGFSVERKKDNGEWINTAFISGKGTTTELTEYSFTDFDLSPGSYEYRLLQYDYDGSRTVSGTAEAEILSKQFFVAQNYPNPFNPTTRIRYTLPDNKGAGYRVSLKMFDILGNEVAVVIDAEQTAGKYETLVDMKNLAGGVYFYQLTAGDYISVNKMILQK